MGYVNSLISCEIDTTQHYTTSNGEPVVINSKIRLTSDFENDPSAINLEVYDSSKKKYSLFVDMDDLDRVLKLFKTHKNLLGIRKNSVYPGDIVKVMISEEGSEVEEMHEFKCVYLTRKEICFLCIDNLGNCDPKVQESKIWNYSLRLNGKKRTGTCKIISAEEFFSYASDFALGFFYHLSGSHAGESNWLVLDNGTVGHGLSESGTVPFIKLRL